RLIADAQHTQIEATTKAIVDIYLFCFVSCVIAEQLRINLVNQIHHSYSTGMDELVPETQLSLKDLEKSTQESIDRVPESPPFNTQGGEEEEDEEEEGEEEIINEYDVEAQLPPQTSGGVEGAKHSKVSEITYDDESHVVGSSKASRRKSTKSISDVVIDIDCEEAGTSALSSTLNETDFEIEEFPEEDDAILLDAVENVQDGVPGEPDGPSEEEVLKEADNSASVLEALALDAVLEAQEDEMRKEFDNFRKFKAGDKIFPDARLSDYNTVAFTMNPSYNPGDPLKPHPQRFVPKWEPKFVPMPCCEEYIYSLKTRKDDAVSSNENADNRNEPETNSSEFKIVKIHGWTRIVETLSAPIHCSQDIFSAVKRFSRVTSEFQALNYCIDEIMSDSERSQFFTTVIPFMKKLVLKLPEIVTCPLPLLRKNVNHNISLNQKQVACLLANAFFSTFPRRFQFETELPSINFKELFADNDDEDRRRLIMKAQKIRCLIHYFTRVAAKGNCISNDYSWEEVKMTKFDCKLPQGVVTYTRKNLRHCNMPDWKKIDKGLSKFVPLIRGTIEDDGAGLLKVDFANKIIGGGVLGRGAVQEEILFVIYPELILTRLFTEKLNYSEAVIVTGCERFCKYTGYSLNFKFDGDYQDATAYDCRGRRCTQIVAIDALYISRPTFQFHPRHITREVNKAFVGFSSPSPSSVAVATGKWGCGAFNGDPQLKAVIQILAASYAGRDIAFFTFGDIDCYKDVLCIYDSIKDLKIKDVWNLLDQYHRLCCSTGKPTRTLKDFCKQYTDGQMWQAKLSETKGSLSSSKATSNLKTVPLTHFYPSEKHKVRLDDSTVADITKGINKINSKHKPPTTLNTNSGKRQREESESNTGHNLTEEEIQQVLQTEEKSKDSPNANVEGKPVSTPDTADVSPKSPKRVKLPDFFDPAI
ncbi:Poly(ADP-ribose) glycohydrolase, partial [Orchesella cincta]